VLATTSSRTVHRFFARAIKPAIEDAPSGIVPVAFGRDVRRAALALLSLSAAGQGGEIGVGCVVEGFDSAPRDGAG
jgi:hypothetical protein